MIIFILELGKNKKEGSMSINEIFCEAKQKVVMEIKELKKRHRVEVLQKEATIKELQCQLAELTRTTSGTCSKVTIRKPRKPKEVVISFEELRHLRKQRGLTQEQIAILLEVSHPTYSSWETNRHAPRASGVKKILAFKEMRDCAFQRLFAQKFPDTPIPKKRW